MKMLASAMSPERQHLGRRLGLTLVLLLAFATVAGLVVGSVLKVVILWLTGLV